LSSGDFDAPGRTAFVTRALAWVAPLVTRLEGAGLDVEAVPLPAAENHAIGLRKPGLGPRAMLVLEIDASMIAATLELPTSAAEVEILRAQLERDDAALRITTAFERLPEPFEVGLGPVGTASAHAAGAIGSRATAARATVSRTSLENEPVPRVAAALDREGLRTLVARAVDEGRRIRVGWRIPRAVALEHAADLDGQLEGALAALAVPFALLSRTDARPPRPRLLASASLFGRTVRRAARRDLLPIEVGARVRVVRGPFEGKVATVHALEGKGAARIRLGLLSTRLPVADLALEAEGPGVARISRRRGRGRSALLSSSHRRR
jgi:hypothetical protein